MPHFRFLAACCSPSACLQRKHGASASILIQIDKRAQTMTVAVDEQLRYRWPVSTGATGFSTPVGSYTPFRMEVMHSFPGMGQRRHAARDLSSPREGTASMARTIPCPGTPVSHGCVRLTLSNATTLYQFVQANGMSQTKVVVRGPDPPASRSRASSRDSGHGSGDHFNFSSSSAICLRLSRSPVIGSIIAVPNTLDLASSSMWL